MHTTLSRSADLPAAPVTPHSPAVAAARKLGRLLSTLAYAAAERVTSPYRDMPPEFYRFPPL
jgi:hypothetical protein